MTIAGGILCPNGIVLCADTQETIGSYKRNRPKLVELPLLSHEVSAVVVGSTDNAVFLDELIENISEAIDLTDGYLSSVRKGIASAMRTHCGEIWKLCASAADRPIAQMLIGLKTIDSLSLLEMYAPHIRNVPNFEFIGDGSDLAGYKAKHFFTAKMPVEAAATLAAYILEVVKENNLYCSGPTQMALIKSDGSIEHKTEEFSRRTGTALMKWDYYSNRLASMIPFVSVGDKRITDYLLDATADNFMTDTDLEKILFAMIEGRLPEKPITVADWGPLVAVIEKRGALNLTDADAFDRISETEAIIKEHRAAMISDSLSQDLKPALNELIEAHNAAIDASLKWRALVERHQEARSEEAVLREALEKLATALNSWTETRIRLLGAGKSEPEKSQ